MTAAGRVTIIVPVYNEEAFIESCLTSVIEDPMTEVLVVDGGSTDATREVVTGLMPRLPGLRLLDNPRKSAASAMNIGLAEATGDLIVRLDAHSRYPPGYVQRLTTALREHAADVAGGAVTARAREATVFGRAIAASLTNRWVMGNTGFRVGGGEIRQVDTVPFGCWHARLLRDAGGFNEDLHRSQDYDLSQRLKRQGAKIILVPDVVIQYYARSGLWENISYNFGNGYWVGYPLVAFGIRFSARHLVAAAACLLGAFIAAACVVSSSPWPLLLASPYLLVMFMSAVASRHEGFAVAACLPLLTIATHALYGFGTLYGVLKGLAAKCRRLSGDRGMRVFGNT